MARSRQGSYEDGGVVRTSIMLMDGVPNLRLMLNDASLIARIRSVSGDSAGAGAACRARAYEREFAA